MTFLTLLGAALITIKLPASDLVTREQPYRLAIEVTNIVATTQGVVTVSIHRAEPGLKNPVPLTMTCPLASSITLSTESLAEGEYAGEVRVQCGDVTTNRPIGFFRLPDYYPATIPFGVYAVPFGADPAATAQRLHDIGFDLICEHMATVGPLAPALDRAARLGMRFMPSTNTGGWGLDMNKPEFQETMSDGEKLRRPCLNQPTIRDKAAEAFGAFVKDYRAHPGFSGLVDYGDDLALSVRHKPDGAKIACYCDTCRAGFKQKYGKDAPTTTKPLKGVVPDDDPWLQWMRYRCEDDYGAYMAAMATACRQVDKHILVGTVHGWSEQPFVNLSSAIYPVYDQRPFPVVSSYCYPTVVSPRMDFIGQRQIGRMGNRDKDAWMVGEMIVGGYPSPPWMVKQDFWNMLAAGYKLISFFSWWDYHVLEKTDKKELADIAVAETAKCGKIKDWFFPTAYHWQDVPTRNACLYSFATDAAEIAPDWRYGQQQEEVTAFYRLALRRQLPLDVISEEEILGGILKNYDHVCLYGTKVLPTSVHKAIEAYAAAGGHVFQVDDSPVKISGAQPAAPDTAVEIMANRQPPAVEINNPDITCREFRAGAASYFVLVNNYSDRYWGMRGWWLDLPTTFKDGRLVTEQPVTGVAKFRERGLTLFDLVTGQVVGNTDKPFEVKLAPSAGQVLMALPNRELALDVRGPKSSKPGETVSFMFDAHSTVQVEVKTPSGRRSRYSNFYGTGEFRLSLGVNDETGVWRLTFTGGFPRRNISRTLNVTRTTALPPALSGTTPQ